MKNQKGISAIFILLGVVIILLVGLYFVVLRTNEPFSSAASENTRKSQKIEYEIVIADPVFDSDTQMWDVTTNALYSNGLIMCDSCSQIYWRYQIDKEKPSNWILENDENRRVYFSPDSPGEHTLKIWMNIDGSRESDTFTVVIPETTN